MLHALIMAGGAGTRFWPISRQSLPKQLLSLAGDESLLQQTVSRLEGLIRPEQLLVMTNQSLVEAVRDQLPSLAGDAVVGEPAKRDTAPCIALAAALMLRQDPDAVMLVTPADHVIGPIDVFQRAVSFAVDLVGSHPSRLVTFGIRPGYPAESFGYIERGEPISAEADELAAYRVKQFREKPDRKTAEQYLAAGSFYWNAGIFVWRAETILDALRQFEPEMVQQVERIAQAWESERRQEVFTKAFGEIQGKSIDYAVMERYDEVAVIEAPFQWDDLGSWKALARLRGTDSSGNTVIGRHLGESTRDCIIRSDDRHLIATYNVENLIIVHTDDATLVACRDSEESVRALVAALKERGWDEYL